MFVQVYSSLYGATERYKNEISCYRAKQGHDIKCLFTPAEYIEFSQLWEWHKKNYLAERKKMRKLFESGYIQKHHLYPTEIAEEFKSKNEKLSLDELMAIEAMANMCENKTFHKQIGKEEGSSSQDSDEDDD